MNKNIKTLLNRINSDLADHCVTVAELKYVEAKDSFVFTMDFRTSTLEKRMTGYDGDVVHDKTTIPELEVIVSRILGDIREVIGLMILPELNQK